MTRTDLHNDPKCAFNFAKDFFSKFGIAFMLRIQRATFYPRPATDGGGTTRGAEKILGGTGNDSFITDHEKKFQPSVRPSE